MENAACSLRLDRVLAHGDIDRARQGSDADVTAVHANARTQRREDGQVPCALPRAFEIVAEEAKLWMRGLIEHVLVRVIELRDGR